MILADSYNSLKIKPISAFAEQKVKYVFGFEFKLRMRPLALRLLLKIVR